MLRSGPQNVQCRHTTVQELCVLGVCSAENVAVISQWHLKKRRGEQVKRLEKERIGPVLNTTLAQWFLGSGWNGCVYHTALVSL